MRGCEAEQTPGESVALDHREHGAEERAVRTQHVEGERSGGQSARERDDRDPHVVDDDERTDQRPEAIRDIRPQPPLREMRAGLGRQRVRGDLGEQQSDRQRRQQRDREDSERHEREATAGAEGPRDLARDHLP